MSGSIPVPIKEAAETRTAVRTAGASLRNAAPVRPGGWMRRCGSAEPEGKAERRDALGLRR